MSASPIASRLSWFTIAAALALVADQATKYGIFARLQLRESVEVIPNLLFFTHNHLNQGALFGLGNNHGELSNYCFAVFSFCAMIFILWWSRREDVRSDRLLLLALGLIFGGAAGNLYDRLVYVGVRDFIWVHREFTWFKYTFDFAVFNVADSCLVVGAFLLFLHTVFFARKESPAAPPVEAQPAPAAA